MADGPATALQKALVAALKADAGVSALVAARIYDEPPQSVVFPYLRIGAIELRPVWTTCSTAYQVTFGIEGYSRPTSGRIEARSGRIEATRLAEAVEAAIDGQPLTVAGFTAVYVQFRTQTVARDADGKSYASISAFDVLLDVSP